jgi:uncharacterized protein YjbI with pentapeptide repeats
MIMKNRSKQAFQVNQEHRKRCGHYIPPVKQTKFLAAFYLVEKRLETTLDWLKNLAFIEIIQLVGNLSILSAVIFVVFNERQQRNTEIYQAWQVVTAAYEQPGSGGRIEALEFLNSKPRRIPWFWLQWEQQSLAGLAAQKAYLVDVQLSDAILINANLEKAILARANLQQTTLLKANLQGSILEDANLQKSILVGTNLQNADLAAANLQEALLAGANLDQANVQAIDLRRARYTDKNTPSELCQKYFLSYPCPTIFPSNFDPQVAGMILLK